MWLRVAFILMTGVAIPAQRLIGDHVCPEEEKYTILVSKPYTKNVTVRDFIWCTNFPPRCSRYRIVQKTELRTEEEARYRTVYKCCNGYVEDRSATNCIPDCSKCIHGKCDETVTCICTAGYTGSSCNQTCPTGRWGLGCASECDCRNEAPCDTKTGYCQCLPDWAGSKCDSPIISDSSNCPGRNCSTHNEHLNVEIIQETSNDSDEVYLKNKTGMQVPEAYGTDVHNPVFPQENAVSLSSQPQIDIGNETKHTTENIKSMKPVITETSQILMSKKNFNVTGETDRYSVENSEHLFMDEIRIIKSSSDVHTYGNLVSSISIAIAVAVILILIAIISILIARYKKRRNLITQKVISASKPTDNNQKRHSSEPILKRSSFNAPLPDPPMYQNPIFTLTSDNTVAKISDVKVHYTNCEGANEVQYDYPPSTGSYRAAYIPEPDSEPMYDEIPAWKQLKPVTDIPLPEFYTAQCGHSYNDGAICEWRMKT